MFSLSTGKDEDACPSSLSEDMSVTFRCAEYPTQVSLLFNLLIKFSVVLNILLRFIWLKIKTKGAN
jgi:hypothetical protein